jgi:hypothetical protein
MSVYNRSCSKLVFCCAEETYSVVWVDEGIVDGDDVDVILLDTVIIMLALFNHDNGNAAIASDALTHCGRRFYQYDRSR